MVSIRTNPHPYTLQSDKDVSSTDQPKKKKGKKARGCEKKEKSFALHKYDLTELQPVAEGRWGGDVRIVLP